MCPTAALACVLIFHSVSIFLYIPEGTLDCANSISVSIYSNCRRTVRQNDVEAAVNIFHCILFQQIAGQDQAAIKVCADLCAGGVAIGSNFDVLDGIQCSTQTRRCADIDPALLDFGIGVETYNCQHAFAIISSRSCIFFYKVFSFFLGHIYITLVVHLIVIHCTGHIDCQDNCCVRRAVHNRQSVAFQFNRFAFFNNYFTVFINFKEDVICGSQITVGYSGFYQFVFAFQQTSQFQSAVFINIMCFGIHHNFFAFFIKVECSTGQNTAVFICFLDHQISFAKFSGQFYGCRCIDLCFACSNANQTLGNIAAAFRFVEVYAFGKVLFTGNNCCNCFARFYSF